MQEAVKTNVIDNHAQNNSKSMLVHYRFYSASLGFEIQAPDSNSPISRSSRRSLDRDVCR